ncbi:MAG TPA: hypothetical protein VLA21_08525 [Candidatus Limnocylindria bacterium]|nr:hypothetical protein [Candidatus Limnocylindria bacterium]
MKKSLAILLALLMLTASFSALAETYAMNEENFTSEQGPVWFYRYYTGETDEILDLNLTPEWGDNWQFSENPNADSVYHSLFEWDGIHAMAGTWLGFPVDMLLVFVAPKDGKATIEPMSFLIKDDGSGNEYQPYLVQIQHVSGDSEPVNLLGDGEEFVLTPYETEAIEVDLKAGDELRFVVRAPDQGGAAVSVQPTVTYAE